MTLPHAVCPWVCANSCHEDICLELVVDRDFSGLHKYLACDHATDHLFILEEVVRLSHCQSLQNVYQHVSYCLPENIADKLFWIFFLHSYGPVCLCGIWFERVLLMWFRDTTYKVHKNSLPTKLSASTVEC